MPLRRGRAGGNVLVILQLLPVLAHVRRRPRTVARDIRNSIPIILRRIERHQRIVLRAPAERRRARIINPQRRAPRRRVRADPVRPVGLPPGIFRVLHRRRRVFEMIDEERPGDWCVLGRHRLEERDLDGVVRAVILPCVEEEHGEPGLREARS